GCAWGDFNNDGFLDLIVANGGFFRSECNRLYRNIGNRNSWIVLKLIGRACNRTAIAPTVRARSRRSARMQSQPREIPVVTCLCPQRRTGLSVRHPAFDQRAGLDAGGFRDRDEFQRHSRVHRARGQERVAAVLPRGVTVRSCARALGGEYYLGRGLFEREDGF